MHSEILQPLLTQTLTYPVIFQHHPHLNKIVSSPTHLFCAYSNGQLLTYNLNPGLHDIKLCDQTYIYSNTDIIDLQVYQPGVVATCTHSELTLYNLEKQKSISLKGHEESPIAISCHPFSPLIVSVSNLLIQHDLRIRKPINVNFITPPVYGVEYSYDGSYYLLSGEPIRIGSERWMRTLNNGIATNSPNSKYVLSNQMNGTIVVWDWRKSDVVEEIKNVQNLQEYQPIHFRLNKANVSEVLFLEEKGILLMHSLDTHTTTRHPILPIPQSNSKMHVYQPQLSTAGIFIYGHQSCKVQCYSYQ